MEPITILGELRAFEETPELIALRKEETVKLDGLEKSLNHEYESGDLTGAQRMSALSEVRKVIYLRSLINGLVPTTGETTA